MAEHLGMIQGIINRMAANSFQIKGWTVTLLAALGAAGVASQYSIISILGYLPLIIFWGLDGYYLNQEKIFRDVYNHARTKPTVDFEIDPSPYQKGMRGWWRATKSPTISVFYTSLLILYTFIANPFNFWQNTCT